MSDPIIERIEQVIASGPGERLVAADQVNQAGIRHWCSAFGETNPAYTDPRAAAASRHGQIVAPPTMLGSWTIESPRDDGGPRDKTLRVIEEGGYEAVVATDYEHEYLEPMTLGMRLSEQRSIEWIEGPKDTALGRGYFVGTRYDYHDQDGTLVGIARMKLLKFRPRTSS